MNILPLHSKQCSHCQAYYSETETYCHNCGFSAASIELANRHFPNYYRDKNSLLISDLEEMSILDKNGFEIALNERLTQINKWDYLKT
ncbi:MAG: hypothetical protein ACKVTZ_08280, partial [Bacteroidia bacterium]